MTFSVAEVIVYGLLAAAIVASVLYAGGRTLMQIGATAGSIVVLVAAFAIIAPRARRPIEIDQSDAPPASAASARHCATEIERTDDAPTPPAAAVPPPEQRRTTRKWGRRRRARHAG